MELEEGFGNVATRCGSLASPDMSRGDTRILMQSTNVPTTIPKSQFALPEATLTFKDLSFSLESKSGNNRKTILEPCSGHIESSELVALMGPSGSGKTTLLDMLALKKTA